MKRILSTTLLFCMVLIITKAYGQQNGSQISFKSTKFDFGAIKEDDGITSCVFEFTSTGESPLIIQRIITTCNCISMEWPKQPLAHGENGKIVIKYDPKNRPGPFDKTITVYTNASTPVLVLQVKGVVKEHSKSFEEVYNRLVGNTIRLRNTHFSLGRMLIDGEKTDTLDFVNISSEPIKIGYDLNGLTHIIVKIVPEQVKPNEKGLIIVTFNAKKRNDWGFVIDRFYLTLNDKPISNGIMNVSASIEENFNSLTNEQLINAPKIDFKENEYNFGQVEEGQLVEKEFEFTNTGRSDLVIRKIKASCGCTTVEPSDKVIKPGQTSSFKATVRTTGFSGQHIAKSISIITNDPVNPNTMVKIVGTVNPKNK